MRVLQSRGHDTHGAVTVQYQLVPTQWLRVLGTALGRHLRKPITAITNHAQCHWMMDDLTCLVADFIPCSYRLLVQCSFIDRFQYSSSTLTDPHLHLHLIFISSSSPSSSHLHLPLQVQYAPHIGSRHHLADPSAIEPSPANRTVPYSTVQYSPLSSNVMDGRSTSTAAASPSPTSSTASSKATAILQACRQPIDRLALVALATSDGGLVDDRVRRVACA